MPACLRRLDRCNGRGSPRRRLRRPSIHLLLLAAMSSLCLGCFALSATVELTEGTAGREAQVLVESAQSLSAAYLRAAQAANQEMGADFRHANVTLPADWRLPTDVPAFRESFGVMFSPESMTKQGYRQTLNTAEAEAFELTLPVSGFNPRFAKEGSSTTMRLDVDTMGGEVIRYVWELKIPSSDTTVDWAAFDSLKTQFPPKPPITRSDPSKTGLDLSGLSEEQQRAMALSGFDSMLEGALGILDMSTAGADLYAWYMLRALRDAGFPTIEFRVTLPGKITRHTINDETGGTVAGNTVTFLLDEAFFRRYGLGNITLRVDSEPLEPGEKVPSPQTLKPAPGAVSPKCRRFRIRPLYGWSAGEVVGMGEAWYELQEIDDDGIPGRRCTIRFTGAGLTLGLPGNVNFSPLDQWSEFETRGGPMSLEDFDGVKGSSSSAGAVLGGYGGFHFGTRDDRWQKQADSKGPSWAVGIHASVDWYHGHWTITEPPH